ncbi:hypothetical protein CDL12_04514 [Handroanthus impetiginosus]|uniref:Uncharacterized protein n=1 Tax=Handroanthus impetiginosus TaxID=429701 RepID=A0A2G9HZ32_9LAMI|nr:hypothetical protein CDL12_04514 [Handroanthus impetiginosus]
MVTLKVWSQVGTGHLLTPSQEKLVESSLKNNMSSASSVNMAPYSLTTNHHHQTDCLLSGVLSGTTRHLLQENNQAFGQISANLSSLKKSCHLTELVFFLPLWYTLIPKLPSFLSFYPLH